MEWLPTEIVASIVQHLGPTELSNLLSLGSLHLSVVLRTQRTVERVDILNNDRFPKFVRRFAFCHTLTFACPQALPSAVETPDLAALYPLVWLI